MENTFSMFYKPLIYLWPLIQWHGPLTPHITLIIVMVWTFNLWVTLTFAMICTFILQMTFAMKWTFYLWLTLTFAMIWTFVLLTILVQTLSISTRILVELLCILFSCWRVSVYIVLLPFCFHLFFICHTDAMSIVLFPNVL